MKIAAYIKDKLGIKPRQQQETKPVTSVQEPATTAPEPATVVPAPVTTAPELVKKVKEPAVNVSEPVTKMPEPAPQIPIPSVPDNQLSKMRNSIQKQELEAQLLKEMDDQNEKLRQEKMRLQQEIEAPITEAFEFSPENVELQKAKQYYMTKNAEMKELINKIMSSQDSEPAQQVRQLNAESIESLLKLLIYIVMQKEDVPEGLKKDDVKQSLLDLLKSDQNLQHQLFGNVKVAKQEGILSEEGRAHLARLGLMKAKQSSMLDELHQIDIQQELSDVLTQNLFTLKFVALKTPSSSSAALPASIYFTYKFFNFKLVETDTVSLHTQDKQIKLATQYFLVLPELLQMRQMTQSYDSVLESALQAKYDVSQDQRDNFVKYLHEQQLQIDVFNASTQLHYGTGRIGLIKLLRQGQPTKVLAQEIELFEQSMNQYVGSLQILLTNEGKYSVQDRKKSLERTQTSSIVNQDKPGVALESQKQKSKKVYSGKPIEHNVSQVNTETIVMPSAPPDYMSLSSELSEEARKKLRVARLRQQTAAISELNLQVLNDAEADDWTKQQTLNQIQLVREIKKKQLFMASEPILK